MRRGMTTNPFTLLGLPARFDLREDEIRAAWLRRAAAAHPDRAPTLDEDEQARAAAAYNDARRTLEDPERRANALLAHLGGPSKEADRSLPPSFLPEIMALREALAEAKTDADAARIEELRAAASARREAHIERVAAHFNAAGNPTDPALLADIRRELNAWRYVERMLEQIDEAPPTAH